jgi:hypothetical protein
VIILEVGMFLFDVSVGFFFFFFRMSCNYIFWRLDCVLVLEMISMFDCTFTM